MNLDLRLPLGLLFGIFGLLLVLTGALGEGHTPHGGGLNINLIWGVVMVVFGALMLGLALRARKSRRH